MSSVDTCESGQLGPGSQGCSVLLKSETVFVYKKQPSAQVAEAEWREWVCSEITWDTFLSSPPSPRSHHKQARSGFIPSVTSTVSFTTENLACSRLIYYEKENILTFLQWHKIVIIGKRDLIIDLSLNYVSSSRLSVSPLLYSLTLVKITAIWVLWIVVLF